MHSVEILLVRQELVLARRDRVRRRRLGHRGRRRMQRCQRDGHDDKHRATGAPASGPSACFLPALSTIGALSIPTAAHERRRARRRLRRPVRPADRQAGAPAARLLRDRPPPDHRRGGRRPAAGGADPLRRTQERPRRRRAVARPGDLRARRADARHLLRRPAHRPALRWHRRARPARRVRAGQVAPRPAVAGAARRCARRPRRVDEPLRRHHRGAAPASSPGPRRRTRRWPCSRTTTGASTACSSTPRSSTRRTAWACCGGSCTSGPGSPPTWTMSSIIDEQVGRIRAQVGDGRAHLRALRGRRLVGRRGARPPGHRSPADVRVRRHRADAQGRERAGHRDVPPHRWASS